MTAADVYRALWRHKYVIIALTAACVAAAWYATSRQDRIYEASMLVRVQQRATDPGDTLAVLEGSERLSQTYAKIIDSGALTERIVGLAAKKGSAADASDVELSGAPVEGVALLWISARSTDPVRAASVANAAPSALRKFVQTSSLPDQIVAVKAATAPRSPVAPNTSLNIALAFLLALVFNSALVLLFEVLRDRLPESDELGPELGYPVLVTVPTLRLRRIKDVEAAQEEGVLAVSPSVPGPPSRRARP